MKISQLAIATIAGLILTSGISAQVPSPKHESRLRHFLGAPNEADNLQQRFKELKCSLVLIRTPTEFGTGFFISRDGDIATASHVLGQRVFTSQPNGKMKVDLVMPLSFTIINQDGESTEVGAQRIEKNGDAWGADVAVLKSGIHTSCWLEAAP